MLQSYLNMLKVIQITNGGEEDLKFQIKIKAVNDEDVVQKVKDFVAIFFSIFYTRKRHCGIRFVGGPRLFLRNLFCLDFMDITSVGT